MGLWIETFKRLSSLDRRIIQQLETTAARNLSPRQLLALAILYECDDTGARPSVLARTLGIAPTSFTPTLDTLEKAKLIKRRPHSTDRRGVMICLTAAGTDLRETIMNAVQSVEKEL